MSQFKTLNLYGSGPHRFVVQSPSLRFDEQGSPGAVGMRLRLAGVDGRRITQAGTLLADSAAGLREQVNAIEKAMDGGAGTLIDEHDQQWSGVVMRRFVIERQYRRGPRHALDYTAEYMQMQPEAGG